MALTPTWIVQVNNMHGGTPCWLVCADSGTAVMMFTFGVIPKIGTALWKSEFVITPPRGTEGRPSSLQFEDRRGGVCGWISLPLLLMPWWFASDDSSRQCGPIAERLAAAIAAAAAQHDATR